MTAVAAPSATAREGLARLAHAAGPLLLTGVAAVVLWLADTPVGDLQAAIAREQAAESGVGVTYWFSWYGGLSPACDKPSHTTWSLKLKPPWQWLHSKRWSSFVVTNVMPRLAASLSALSSSPLT